MRGKKTKSSGNKDCNVGHIIFPERFQNSFKADPDNSIRRFRGKMRSDQSHNGKKLEVETKKNLMELFDPSEVILGQPGSHDRKKEIAY